MPTPFEDPQFQKDLNDLHGAELDWNTQRKRMNKPSLGSGGGAGVIPLVLIAGLICSVIIVAFTMASKNQEDLEKRETLKLAQAKAAKEAEAANKRIDGSAVVLPSSGDFPGNPAVKSAPKPVVTAPKATTPEREKIVADVLNRKEPETKPAPKPAVVSKPVVITTPAPQPEPAPLQTPEETTTRPSVSESIRSVIAGTDLPKSQTAPVNSGPKPAARPIEPKPQPKPTPIPEPVVTPPVIAQIPQPKPRPIEPQPAPRVIEPQPRPQTQEPAPIRARPVQRNPEPANTTPIWKEMVEVDPVNRGPSNRNVTLPPAKQRVTGATPFRMAKVDYDGSAIYLSTQRITRDVYQQYALERRKAVRPGAWAEATRSEAQDFAIWLTHSHRRKGYISSDEYYRLPNGLEDNSSSRWTMEDRPRGASDRRSFKLALVSRPGRERM